MGKRKNKNDNSINDKYLSNSPISNLEEDYIGVDEYISTIKQSVNNGDKMISLSSNYGEGKSSIINIISNSNNFKKVSVVSLYDMQNINNNSDKQYNLKDFYKSFLYKLATDFKGIKYAKYIGKLFNENISRLSLNVKKRSYFILLVFAIISFIIGLAFHSNNDLLKFLPQEHFFHSYKVLVAYILFIISIIMFSLVIVKSKMLFTYWNSNNNINITNEEVTTIYAELIDDSLSYFGTKHSLIVIEDVDRCVQGSENSEIVKDFLRLMNTLSHYKCKNYRLLKKLNKVHFIVCVDESKLCYSPSCTTSENNMNDKDSFENEEILKLFDFRIYVGSIYNYGYNKLLFEFAQNIGLKEYVSDLNVLLKSPNNTLRFLKNELNDIKLKYIVIQNKFKEKNPAIAFKSCIAFSYLKNNFLIDFNNHKEEEASTTIEECIYNKINDNKLPDYELGKDYITSIQHFISIGYLDQDYKKYFYNISKLDDFKDINQEKYYQIACDNNSMSDEEVNSLIEYIDQSYIINCDENPLLSNIPYHFSILKHKKITDIIIKPDDINPKISTTLLKYIDLNEVELLKCGILFLESIEKCSNDVIYTYLYKIYSSINNKKIVLTERTKDLFYQFRHLSIKFLKDDIYSFPNWFTNNLESIKFDELQYLNSFLNINKVININIITTDLEKVLCHVKEYLATSTLELYCQVYASHIKTENLFVEFACYTLNQCDFYMYKILNLIKKYRHLINLNMFNFDLQKRLDIYSYNNYEFKDSLLLFNSLSDDSLADLYNNGNYKTHITKLLKSKSYDEINDSKYSEQLKEIIDSDFNYIKEELIEFKRYLLETNVIGFNYLFDNYYDNLIKIEYEVNDIKNPYIVVMKLNDKESLYNYMLSNKITLDTYNLSFILGYINNNVFSLCDYDFIDLLLNEFKSFVLYDFNEQSLIKQLICNLTTNDKKIELIIKYQMLTNSFISECLSIISNCNNKDLLYDYANYINGYDINKLDINAVIYCPIKFEYNEAIINLLVNNRFYGHALVCMNSSNDKKKHCINNLSSRDIYNVYKLGGTSYFLNDEFMKRVSETNAMNLFSLAEILNIFNNYINRPSINGQILDCLSVEKFKDIVLKYPNKNTHYFVAMLKESKLAHEVFNNDNHFKIEIYSKLGSYKSSFTIAFKKQ